jgi:hypothetical protein
MSKEAMKLALEALAVKFSKGWHEGIKIDASDIMLLNDAAQALAEQPAQDVPEVGFGNTALDKKAENARELGLDYEPDYKVTVVDDQHPSGVPLEQWGRVPNKEKTV